MRAQHIVCTLQNATKKIGNSAGDTAASCGVLIALDGVGALEDLTMPL